MFRQKKLAILVAAVAAGFNFPTHADDALAPTTTKQRQHKMKMTEPMTTEMMRKGMVKGDVKAAATAMAAKMRPKIKREEGSMPQVNAKPAPHS